MNAIPTTTVSILGPLDGTTTHDQYGDPVDSTTVTQAKVPCAISTGREVVATESDTNAVVVRYFTGRVPWGTQVVDTQRIRDEVTGDIYSIDNVTRPQNPVLPQDVRLDLRRVT